MPGSSATCRCSTTSSRRSAPRDVHLVGHVSNEELIAYYELADVFVCASEHEGFCVPLVESFHMGVPVIAYAATAVPSTMDGAGVLYTDKDPLHVAGLINAIVDDQALADQHRRRTVRGARSARPRRISRARCCGTSTTCWRRRAASIRRSRSISGTRSIRPRSYDEIKAYRPSAFLALPPTGNREPGTESAGTGDDPASPAMIVNQWVPAAHKGDAIGDSARRVRGAAARNGTPVRSLRDDDRRRPARRCDPVDGCRRDAAAT